ncbi:MAG: hypothetical protein IPK80_25840 [Nannocystis sp.]|nr:hypothetical protein [Nannocystis sp.]
MAPLTVTVTVEEVVRLRSTLAAGPQVLRTPTGCASLCAAQISFDKTITAAKGPQGAVGEDVRGVE